MLESYESVGLNYDKITQEEMSSRGILGRLQGVIADGKNPTRNGRRYSSKLWERVFEDPIVRESIDNRLCVGELGHPLDDRTETDMEKICICLNGYPTINKDQQLMGNFDILDTPNGRILNTLAKYGANIGVSSRGEGDLYTDADGNECVDEGTYQFQCFDAVIIPAVKSARMNYMTESLEKNKTSLKEALDKELANASEKDRKVMMDTITELGLDETYTVSRGDTGDFDIKTLTRDVVYSTSNKEDAEELASKLELTPDEADTTDSTVEELQEAIKNNRDLSKQLKDAKEDLAASHTRERELEDQINQLKEGLTKLALSAKKAAGLEKRVKQLSEALEKSTDNISQMTSDKGKLTKEKSSLDEALSKKDQELKSLSENLSKLSANSEKLTEQLTAEKEENKSLKEQLSRKNDEIRKQKKVASRCVEKFIESKAQMIGVTSSEIINRLPESYSFSDIEKVTESLKRYQVNLSKLPFDIDAGTPELKVTKQQRRSSTDDDEDLTSLYLLAGLD